MKFHGTYDFNFGRSLGAFVSVPSGSPMTASITWQGYPVYYNGRGDLGRSPTLKSLDFNVSQEFRMGGRKRLVLNANINNLFDFKTPLDYAAYSPWRSGVNPPDSTFYGGPWDPQAEVDKVRAAANNPTAIRDSDCYKVWNSVQGRRDIRLNVKFTF